MEKAHNPELFAMLTYQIWSRRNKLRLGERVANLKLINTMAIDALQEFHQANFSPPKPPPEQSHIIWKPPPSDWVKANFDGAVFKEQAEAGLGFIIRNDRGLVMAALTQSIPLPTSMEMVEVLAARRTLLFAKELDGTITIFSICMEKAHNPELFAMLTYQIWSRRNKLRLGERVANLKLINTMAIDALQEFHQANFSPPKPPPEQSHIIWKPPPSDWVKANFDGAVFKEQAEAGLGFIIRNDRGLVMAALTQSIPLPTSMEMVEVLAARRTLLFAKELGFEKVILEGDFEIAIQAMKNDAFSAAPFGHIVSDIKALSSHFRCLTFQHTCRQGNLVAHSLARAACNFPHFCTWIEEVPVSSSSLYLAEIINTT
nr:hypothetical protein CFP56_14609 [Quercus suber]